MPQRPPRRIQTKKLLVASLGVATISYAAACGSKQSYPAGNLMPPDRPQPELDGGGNVDPIAAEDAGANEPRPLAPTSGNLMPPEEAPKPAPVDAGAPSAATKDAGASKDAGARPLPQRPVGPRIPPTSGNLMAPHPPTPKPKTK